jgi:hypothetical protein
MPVLMSPNGATTMATFAKVAAELDAKSLAGEDCAELIHDIVTHLYDMKGYNSADDVRSLLGLASFQDVDGILELMKEHGNEEF